MSETVYKRILLKLSGEALNGGGSDSYNAVAIEEVVEKIRRIVDDGIEVALVVGAGNLWRGVNGADRNMDKVSADYMGMLATVMNGICLRDAFNAAGISALLQTSVAMCPFADQFNRGKAIQALESGQVVIFAGGTGSPFFTTDTTAALRALETDCEAVLKATKVDGVYSADPVTDPNALRFEQISYRDALAKELKVMDSAAFSLCRDNNLPIVVFNFGDPDGLDRIIRGDTSTGSVVC